MKTLPGRMAELEAGIAKLREVLSDSGLYGRDPARFQKATAMLGAAETELAAAEERWLTLEMQRESQGG